MSSILDALRQLETEKSHPGQDDVPPVEPGGRTRWIIIALGGACAVGCLAFWMLWPRAPGPVAPAPGPDASLAGAGAESLPPAAPAPPLRAANAEPPRARMTSQAAPTAVEPPEERTAARTPERAPGAVAAPRYEPPPSRQEPPPDASASAGVGRVIPRPPGEPVVRISSLSYSPSPTRRVVSLSVNDSNPISVREGETIGGVQVTLIMPDGVYVKHAGNIFAVSR